MDAKSSVQFLSKLTLNNSLVPTLDSNKSFKYLGRYFNFNMDNIDHMSTLLSTIKDLMIKTDSLLCHPKYKLLLWHLTIADLSKTWAIDNLDNIITSCIRNWFELPITATISSLILNKSRYDINLVLPSTKFIKCQTVIRNALISSLWISRLFGMRLNMVQIFNMINFKILSKFSSLFNMTTKSE